MNTSQRYAMIIFPLCLLLIITNAYGQDWRETYHTDLTPKNFIVTADDGSKHILDLSYKGVVWSYEHQTGSSSKPLAGRIRDTRKCYYGFSWGVRREVFRTLPMGDLNPPVSYQAQGLADDIHVPNFIATAQSAIEPLLDNLSAGIQYIEFGNYRRISTESNDIRKIMVALTEARQSVEGIAELAARLLGLRSGVNCGEARGQINDAAAKHQAESRRFTPLVATIDQVVVLKDIIRHWRYIDSEGFSHRAIFVLPLDPSEEYTIQAAANFLNATKLLKLDPNNAELQAIQKGLDLTDPDWEQNMWFELAQKVEDPGTLTRLQANIINNLIKSFSDTRQSQFETVCILPVGDSITYDEQGNAKASSQLIGEIYPINQQQVGKSITPGCVIGLIPNPNMDKQQAGEAYSRDRRTLGNIATMISGNLLPLYAVARNLPSHPNEQKRFQQAAATLREAAEMQYPLIMEYLDPDNQGRLNEISQFSNLMQSMGH